MIIDARVRLPAALRPDPSPPADIAEGYAGVLDVFGGEPETLDDLRAVLDEAGVDRAVVHAEYEGGDVADALNDAVAELVAAEPDRFKGVGTVSQDHPIDIMRTVGQVARCAELGFAGVSLQPAFFHGTITDKHLYPVYAKAAELDLMVFVHTGINYGRTHPIEGERPAMLDEIACAFPDLTLIAAHAGWPWVPELVAVMRKHPTVLAEFGGLAPKYVGAPASGWEVMHRFMNSLLSEQVLFGTDWPAFAPGRALEEWRALDLKPAVLDRLLGGNAARLFGW